MKGDLKELRAYVLLLVTMLAVANMPDAVEAQAQANPAIGTWAGVLNFPGQTLHLIVHVSEAGAGLSATLDSPDQNVFGAPIDSFTLTNQDVQFSIVSRGILFDGTQNGGTIAGTFNQNGVSVPLVLTRKIVSPDNVGDLDGMVGDWSGRLQFPNGTMLRIVLHVRRTESGLGATADSPDQNALGIPVDLITLNGDTLDFTIARVGAQFNGTLGQGSIAGTFTQNGINIPLTLTHSASAQHVRPRQLVRGGSDRLNVRSGDCASDCGCSRKLYERPRHG